LDTVLIRTSSNFINARWPLLRTTSNWVNAQAVALGGSGSANGQVGLYLRTTSNLARSLALTGFAVPTAEWQRYIVGTSNWVNAHAVSLLTSASNLSTSMASIQQILGLYRSPQLIQTDSTSFQQVNESKNVQDSLCAENDKDGMEEEYEALLDMLLQENDIENILSVLSE